MIRLAILQAIAGPDFAITARDQSGRFAETKEYGPLGRVIILLAAGIVLLAVLLLVGAK